jgi:photosystem II stability/assembly factor-like uncharacterized protein
MPLVSPRSGSFCLQSGQGGSMKIRLIASTALVLVATSLAVMQGRASAQERVTAVKMLAPGTGWALKGGSLYWTSTNGASWRNITPPAPAMFESMSSVFFLDTRVGWVLFAGGGEEATFHLASTTDAGANWSVTRVTLPPPARGYPTIIGQARIAFSDPAHGCINITAEGGAAFAPGRLAMTTDGGRTWDWAPEDPLVRGSLVAVTPNEIWLAGGGDNSRLFVTYNAARSWREVTLPAPKEIAPARDPTYDLPTFVDQMHGFEAVTFVGPGFQGAAVLFDTVDGGRTWRADRIVTNLTHLSGGQIVDSAVADSTWVVRTSDGAANALRLGPGARAQAPAAVRYGITGEPEVSFISSGAGWIATDSRLQAAGSSPSESHDITPRGSVSKISTAWPSEPALPSPRLTQDPNQNALTQGPSRAKAMLQPTHRKANAPLESRNAEVRFATIRPMDSSSTGLGVSQHIGFDKCAVLDPQTFLSVWWTNSPYFDVGFYLPGASGLVTCDVSTLTSTWIAQVSAQGWGLMPIWSGLQAPCHKGSSPTFDWDPTDAQIEGEIEALTALASAASLAGCGKTGDEQRSMLS